jgi:hypothetical protein
MAYLALGLLGGLLLGGLFLLGKVLRDPRRHEEGARGGPGTLTLLRAARCRARRNLLGRRQKVR